MNISPKHGNRHRRRRRAKTNEVIIIDSDTDDNEDADLDRKPAAKNTGGANDATPRKKIKNTIIAPCISLIDSSDEENRPCVRATVGGVATMTTSSSQPPKGRRKRRTKKPSLPTSHATEAADRELAERLQAQEDRAAKASPRKEKEEMSASSEGKAVLAVQEIVALVGTVKENIARNHPALGRHSVEAVTIDDMVFFAKNMLDKQGEFIREQISGHIDVGYHYTEQKNMANIRTHGLLTKNERQTNNVKAVLKGSVFGDGIYTANNETTFSNYGDTGLLVGRLKGKMVRIARYLRPGQTVDANTIIGDKLTGVASYGKKVGIDGWPVDDIFHEFVLRSSSQCLPMIRFDKAMRDSNAGKACIKYMEKSLQGILDKIFNGGQRSVPLNAPLITSTALPKTRAALPAQNAPLTHPAPPIFAPPPPAPGSNYLHPGVSAAAQRIGYVGSLPIAATSAAARALPSFYTNSNIAPSNPPMPQNMRTGTKSTPALARRVALRYAAPVPGVHTANIHRNYPSYATSQTLRYTAPQSLTTGVPSNALTSPPASCNMNEKCVICHERLKKSRCVALYACNHVFHATCIQLAFNTNPQCPICRVSIGAPQGKSPSGTMMISSSPVHCSGFREDSIIITYNIPCGHQLSYHDNPGNRHGGKHAVAYLPNNKEGQKLLKRLKFSFKHGLSFTVGASMTTGLEGQCTWTSVHHKTSPSGGVRSHGYPDPDYFRNCNSELDGLSVPPAPLLDDNGNVK
eukprot:CAMPEP_0181108426 /NCGR_PEP_ID=MMETSP1071-20121207/17624_1 /TAXON_ID=35127 /ORGANISM="Thalassiosira sp., Strain NH16" /LENGTH=744 /DNA_ID=CAMNT_0023192029 /DNA_START=36 /DNA_END=2270 /DNA_ORIENTATION=-